VAIEIHLKFINKLNAVDSCLWMKIGHVPDSMAFDKFWWSWTDCSECTVCVCCMTDQCVFRYVDGGVRLADVWWRSPRQSYSVPVTTWQSVSRDRRSRSATRSPPCTRHRSFPLCTPCSGLSMRRTCCTSMSINVTVYKLTTWVYLFIYLFI